MKIFLKSSLSLLVLAAATMLPATASAQSIVATVAGGGVGAFQNTSHSFTTSGHSEFAVNARIWSNGAAGGEFVCAVENIVVFAVLVKSGHVNADGSVTLMGSEYGYDRTLGGGYTGCAASVVLRAGGAGTASFDFKDCVTAPKYDTEKVTVGLINIKRF